jgi:hypothetical protein
LNIFKGGEEHGEPVSFWGGILKGLATHRALAEMIGCKLLSTAAAFVLYMM